MNSEQVHDCLNHALVDQVKEATKQDAGQVDLGRRDFPRFFRFLVEISDQTSGLLDAAAVAFLLRRHVDRCWPATSPLSTRRVFHASSSAGEPPDKSMNGTTSSSINDALSSTTSPFVFVLDAAMSVPSEKRSLGAATYSASGSELI